MSGSWGRTPRQPLLRIVPVTIKGYVLVTELEALEAAVNSDATRELADLKLLQWRRILRAYADSDAAGEIRRRIVDAIRGENIIDAPLEEEERGYYEASVRSADK